MKTRVNLTIEKDLVQQIKLYAAKKQTSVSDLVEEYFSRITRSTKRVNIIDMVKDLPKPDIDNNLDLKKAFYEDQSTKYGF